MQIAGNLKKPILLASSYIWVKKFKEIEELPGEERLKRLRLFSLEMLDSSGLPNQESDGENECLPLFYETLQF